jgi:hypothetical protein
LGIEHGEVGRVAGTAWQRAGVVSCALAAVAVLWARPQADAAASISVFVDGKRVDYYSQVLDERVPALLVGGVPMVSLRFLSGYFERPLDLHLMKYEIVSVGDVSFKLGVPEALRRVPMVGGDPAQAIRLPASPRVVGGRIYVPAIPAVQVVAAGRVSGVQWDAKQAALRITQYKYAGQR